MSEDKKELELPNQTSGFTLKELEEVEQYKLAGLPDLIEVTDEKLMMAFDMRLNGRSYYDIATTLGLKKIVVMYLGDKYDWHKRRQEFLDGYEMHMKDQILEEKIHSQHFIMKAMLVFRKRMNKKFNRYLQTGEEPVNDSIDFKEMSLYLKMAETVAGLDARGLGKDPNGQPLIGVNAGDGVTIKRMSDNTVEITPRQKSHSEMLAELAKSKREHKTGSENK